jgi:three-Cys-motif partner protein
MAAEPEFDEIGYWSEIKLEILREYARAYTGILSRRRAPSFHYSYIDAFSGAGKHRLKSTGGYVPGSPLNALNVQPPFLHHHFIDLNEEKVSYLRDEIGSRRDVSIYEGDCNKILLEQVFPTVRREDYRRAICLLDPYGLHLEWPVIANAGAMRSIEIFLNFPVMDINRNVLWRDPSKVSPQRIQRMNAFWGDESWRQAAYAPEPQGNLFRSEPDLLKRSNHVIAGAFRERLRKVAGFAFVPEPIPMINENNAVVYYLFFGSPNETGHDIVVDIFNKYRNQMG